MFDKVISKSVNVSKENKIKNSINTTNANNNDNIDINFNNAKYSSLTTQIQQDKTDNLTKADKEINIKLDLPTKFTMYKQMRSKESKMWLKSDHIMYALSEISLINFDIYCIYKLYYNVYNNNILFLHNFKNSRFSTYVAGLFVFNVGCFYLLHHYLDIHIYKRNYVDIADKDYAVFYNQIMYDNKAIVQN